MKKTSRLLTMLPMYLLVLGCCLILIVSGNKAITVAAENTPLTNRKTVIIDAGHGGEDGGATSCTGALESQINLEIAQRLNDLLHLLGIDTVMIRNTDTSIYTQGNTIAAKKVSDLKERVRIVNETDNALLVSIHQNNFSDSQYSGAQVFYAPTDGSADFAKQIQSLLIENLNPGSNRQVKKADGIYLMQHISCTGVLVECGFLSNPEEEARLRNEEYQQELCCVIASACSSFLHRNAAIA